MDYDAIEKEKQLKKNKMETEDSQKEITKESSGNLLFNIEQLMKSMGLDSIKHDIEELKDMKKDIVELKQLKNDLSELAHSIA